MELNCQHPLESITNSKSLSLLESLIPFVDYPLKLPLALFIKINEIKLIINAFHSRDNLIRLGLHTPQNSPMDMIGALTGMSPEMLKMLLSLSENFGDSISPDMLSGLSGNSGMDFSSIFNMMNQKPNTPEQTANPSSSFHKENTEHDNFDLHIQSILSEYDMAQAEAYNATTNEQTDDSVIKKKGE